MTQVKAQELLEDPDYIVKLTMGGMYSLLLRAGYPKEEAHKVAMQHGWNRLDAGLEM